MVRIVITALVSMENAVSVLMKTAILGFIRSKLRHNFAENPCLKLTPMC